MRKAELESALDRALTERDELRVEVRELRAECTMLREVARRGVEASHAQNGVIGALLGVTLMPFGGVSS